MMAIPGLALIELLIALALSALLLLGLVQIAAAASSSTQLQRNQAQVQENARLAYNTLSRAIHRTGYNPQPWSSSFPTLGIADSSLDNVSANGDRLVVRDWSDRNCFDNRNPVVDAAGSPRYFIREFAFDINTDRSLTRQCRYGPALDNLTTQVRRQGFINGVESFQVQFGLDVNQDGNIEVWVNAGGWLDPGSVLGIRAGLLHSSPDAVMEPVSKIHQVLDSTRLSVADGKLRRVSIFTAAIKGRTG